jgi:hypothetical protein
MFIGIFTLSLESKALLVEKARTARTPPGLGV